MTNSKTKGKVLTFDKRKYERIILEAEVRLAHAIKGIIQAYEELGIGKFAASDWEQIAAGDLSKINGRYMETAERDADQFKIAAMRSGLLQNAKGGWQDFEKMVKDLRAIVMRLNGEYEGGNKIHLSDYSIQDGKPILDTSAVEERFRVRITTDNQAALYDKLGEAIDKINDVAGLLDSQGHPIGMQELIRYGARTNESGQAEVNPDFIIDMR
jgi:hypothetical protein